MEQYFILFAKFACPVARRNIPLLPTAHVCETGLYTLFGSRVVQLSPTTWKVELPIFIIHLVLNALKIYVCACACICMHASACVGLRMCLFVSVRTRVYLENKKSRGSVTGACFSRRLWSAISGNSQVPGFLQLWLKSGITTLLTLNEHTSVLRSCLVSRLRETKVRGVIIERAKFRWLWMKFADAVIMFIQQFQQTVMCIWYKSYISTADKG